jgi:hypothetical protein
MTVTIDASYFDLGAGGANALFDLFGEMRAVITNITVDYTSSYAPTVNYNQNGVVLSEDYPANLFGPAFRFIYSF